MPHRCTSCFDFGLGETPGLCIGVFIGVFIKNSVRLISSLEVGRLVWDGV
jgi:hypothetical protein